MTERWLPCPDHEGLYEVSDLGNVRSLYFDPPRPVARIHDSNGYPVAMFSKNGKRTPKTIHRLVCRAFHGESYPPCREAAHLDGVRENCRADNLKWVGKMQNLEHRKAHGTFFVGDKHPRSILTEADAADIKARLAAGEPTYIIAKDYPVTPAAIFDIKRGKNWRGVRPSIAIAGDV